MLAWMLACASPERAASPEPVPASQSAPTAPAPTPPAPAPTPPAPARSEEDAVLAVGAVREGSTPAEAPVVPARPTVTETVPDGTDPIVASTLPKSRARFRACHEQALHQSAVTGDVAVTWEMAGGRVRDVVVTRDTTGSPALADCVARAVRYVRLPTEAEGEASATWTFAAP